MSHGILGSMVNSSEPKGQSRSEVILSSGSANSSISTSQVKNQPWATILSSEIK